MGGGLIIARGRPSRKNAATRALQARPIEAITRKAAVAVDLEDDH